MSRIVFSCGGCEDSMESLPEDISHMIDPFIILDFLQQRIDSGEFCDPIPDCRDCGQSMTLEIVNNKEVVLEE